jgi:hypothetical protein
MVLPCGQKLTLGLLVTVTPVVDPFHAYAPLSALVIFKCILEVEFCEAVQHRPRFCLDHLNYVKMMASQFYLQSENQRKAVWVQDDSHAVFGQTFPEEKAM